jgi:hypothetical protein
MCFLLQLFRRVAAALPGMENTQEKPTNDCILWRGGGGGGGSGESPLNNGSLKLADFSITSGQAISSFTVTFISGYLVNSLCDMDLCI